MPDEWKFSVGLESSDFEQGAAKAADSGEKMGKAVEAAMGEVTASTNEADAAIEKFRAEMAQMREESLKAARAAQQDLAGGLEAVEVSAGKASRKLADVGGEAARGQDKLDRMAKAGMALQLLDGIADPLKEGLAGLNPVAGEVASSLTNVGTAAASGAAIAGPWGAAIAGVAVAAKEAWGWFKRLGEDTPEDLAAAAAATEMLNKNIQENARLVREAAEAGRNAGEKLAETDQGDIRDRKNTESRFGVAKEIANLEEQSRRRRIAEMKGTDEFDTQRKQIEARRQLDQETLKADYDLEQKRKQAAADAARRRLDQHDAIEQSLKEKQAQTPAGDKGTRTETSEKLKELAAARPQLATAAADARNELEMYKERRGALEGRQGKAVDESAQAEMSRVSQREEDAKFRRHDEARKAQLKSPDHPDNQREEQRRSMEREKEGLLRKIDGASFAGVPRDSRGSDAGLPGQIKGAYDPKSYNWEDGRRSFNGAQKMRDAGMMTERAKKVANDAREVPANPEMLKQLDRIARGIDALNRKPERR